MSALQLLLFFILALLAYWLLLVGWTIWRLTRPPRRTAGVALAQGRAMDPARLSPPRHFESWDFPLAHRPSLRLPVWDIRGDNPAGPTIILSHGWGDSRFGALSRVQALAPVASRLIAWDMPGHGEARGSCSLGVREVDALVQLITLAAASAPSQSAPSPIVLFGWSMGAGVSLAAAARVLDNSPSVPGGVAGVIAEAAYRHARTPARNVLVLQGLPVRSNLTPALWCVGVDHGVGRALSHADARFDRAGAARALGCAGLAVLVLHGEGDPVSPLEDARDIAHEARGTLTTVPGMGHFGLWTDPCCAAFVAESVRAWMGGVGCNASPPPSLGAAPQGLAQPDPSTARDASLPGG